MTGNFKRVLVAYAAFCAVSVHAETLPVSGVYPAGNDAAASLNVIAVERFGGADGQQLGIAIADRLRAVVIGGEPYFRIVPGSASGADAVLQGTAIAEVERRDSGTREEDVCVERDADRKCIRREKRRIPCWNHVVRLDATVRLVGVDGDRLHAVDREDEQTQRYCEGDSRPSTEGMVRQLTGRYADSLRADLAPVQRAEDIRVMESREGLSRDDGRAFREAVRLTKDDESAACIAWAALEARNPDSPSVLFNLGLCAESAGELNDAYWYYSRALSFDDDTDYAKQGVQRLEQRERADAQLASQRPLDPPSWLRNASAGHLPARPPFIRAKANSTTPASRGQDMSDTPDRVKKIVVEHLGVEEDKVTPDASFIDDLGADSLDIVELVMAFEEEFGVEIPDDAAEKINTVGDANRYIEEHKG